MAQAVSTLEAIRKKVRRLTASSSESALSTAEIDQYINTFYSQDFPYGIKLDQTRSVYTLYTIPNIDVYPLDVNSNQGIRSPVYFEGVQGMFFKDRQQFFGMWPRWPTQFQPIAGDGTTQQFSFTVGGTPFLRNNVVLGGTSTTGAPIRVADDGNGNMQLQVPDSIGNLTTTTIGTVNYVSGEFILDFSIVGLTPASGSIMTLWVSSYQVGRPYCMLFWNNEFTIRPVPDKVYKVEIETYLTPTQLLQSSNEPTLNQWWQYIAIGAAIKVLEDRQDMEGLENLSALFDRQEALVLERQGIEEIGQRNTTIFTSVMNQQNFGNPQGWY